jgi:hypothetical protein
MAKLYTPKFGRRIGKGSAIHLARARDPTTTVCGTPICEKCPPVEIAKVNAKEEKWCIRCLGSMRVK